MEILDALSRPRSYQRRDGIPRGGFPRNRGWYHDMVEKHYDDKEYLQRFRVSKATFKYMLLESKEASCCSSMLLKTLVMLICFVRSWA